MQNSIVMTIFIISIFFSASTLSEESAKQEEKDKKYTQCISVPIPGHQSHRYIHSGKPLVEARILKIPEGWTPIGGGPAGTAGKVSIVILCK